MCNVCSTQHKRRALNTIMQLTAVSFRNQGSGGGRPDVQLGDIWSLRAIWLSFHPNFTLETEVGQSDPYSAPVLKLLGLLVGSERGSQPMKGSQDGWWWWDLVLNWINCSSAFYIQPTHKAKLLSHQSFCGPSPMTLACYLGPFIAQEPPSAWGFSQISLCAFGHLMMETITCVMSIYSWNIPISVTLLVNPKHLHLYSLYLRLQLRMQIWYWGVTSQLLPAGPFPRREKKSLLLPAQGRSKVVV